MPKADLIGMESGERGEQELMMRAEAPLGDDFLELRQVELSFTTRAGGHSKRIRVLDGLDLTIKRGEFCSIVGPSGCGKSTTLRVIDGLIRPDSGSVVADGRPVTEPSPDKAFVFQQFNLLPWRTVLGNVEFGLENMGVSKKERRERARRWLEVVGLSKFEDYYPAQISGGMQQRVGLARALATEPDTILMDEPFGSVDAQTRMLLQEEILRIWDQDKKKTVLFVTHDIEEALFLSDRVIVMSPRPARILRSVDVSFERPRTDELRGDAEFAHLKEEIWVELKSAILREGPLEEAHD